MKSKFILKVETLVGTIMVLYTFQVPRHDECDTTGVCAVDGLGPGGSVPQVRSRHGQQRAGTVHLSGTGSRTYCREVGGCRQKKGRLGISTGEQILDITQPKGGFTWTVYCHDGD